MTLHRLLAVSLVLAGCGASWVEVRRHGIEVGAVAVDTGDSALTVAVHADCASVAATLLAGSPERRAAVEACLHDHHYDVARDAIHTADAALRSAQAALDAAERSHEHTSWLGIASCLVVAVDDVVAALVAARIHLSSDVLTALAALRAFAGPCPSHAGGP